MKIYIGCAIKETAPHIIEMVDALKQTLSKEGHELLHFVGINPECSHQEIYETDIACASEADLMVAIADMPSTGLGMEIQKRIDLKKPTLVCHHITSEPSRMPLGAAEVYEFCSVVAYQDERDILAAINKLHHES